jgi:hypothetical protein
MLKRIIGTMLALVLVAVSAPAFADNIHIGNTTTNQGGQGGAGGSAAAAASASSTNVNTNINTQGQQQGQGQGQQQGQIQGQGQGQKQEANNDGNRQDVKFEAPLIPGFAAAPGLTSVGTYACLGSLSFGLSGPMAGASFGITKVDKGCEHARDAVILMGWGYPTAALILLSQNEDTAAALKADPKAHAFLKTSTTVASVREEEKKKAETSIPLAMAATQAAAAVGVQGGN